MNEELTKFATRNMRNTNIISQNKQLRDKRNFPQRIYENCNKFSTRNTEAVKSVMNVLGINYICHKNKGLLNVICIEKLNLLEGMSGI